MGQQGAVPKHLLQRDNYTVGKIKMESMAPPWAKILVTVALKMAVESRLR